MYIETLRAGNYALGWAQLEQHPPRQNIDPREKLDQAVVPEWRGEPLKGRSILVWGEWGLGDEIQMARYIPMLRDIGATWIVLCVQQPNVRAFETLGADQVSNRNGPVSFRKVDYWVGMLSLPYLFGTRLWNLSGASYLPRLSEPSGGIGLAWRGNPLNPTDGVRSMPSPELLKDIPNGVFLEPSGDMRDSMETLSKFDALVTVCTSWAHLGGAMGIPTHVLLAHEADWRWGTEDRTPWYDSVRLHRQASPGDWASAVESAKRALNTP